MLSIKEVQKLIRDEKISDEEAERIRTTCYGFAELALEVFLQSTKRKNHSYDQEQR